MYGKTEISLSFAQLKTEVGAPGFSCLPGFCGTLNSDAKLAAGFLLQKKLTSLHK